MKVPQLLHELGPYLRAAVFKHLGAYREVRRGECVAQSPAAHDGHQGDKLDRLLRQAVNYSLLVPRIGTARENPIGGQALQAVRENIGCDPLDAFGEQRPKRAAAAAEHYVAKDNQAPAVAESFSVR